MAIDMTKVQQLKTKITQELSRSGGSGVSAKFWRPEDGDNTIRVMPAWTTEPPYDGQFWREVAQHWGVSEDQKGPVLCPQETPEMGEPCPICAFVDALRQDKNDLAKQKLAKDIRAKKAYFMNIVDLNDDVYTAKDVAEYKKSRPESEVPFAAGDSKIQVYAAPKTVFDNILNVIMTNDHDITDLKLGNDLTINKSGKGLTGTRYTVTPRMKPTEASVQTTDELPALDRVGYVMAHEELLNLLTNGVGDDFVALLPSGAGSAPALPKSASRRMESEDADLEKEMSRALNS